MYCWCLRFIRTSYYDLRGSCLIHVALQSYIQFYPCLFQPHFYFLVWFSRLQWFLYARVPKFLCSDIFDSILLIHISSFICSSGIPLSKSCVAGHFTIGGIRSPPPRIKGIRPSPYLPRRAPFIFQIPSRNHAMPLLYHTPQKIWCVVDRAS